MRFLLISKAFTIGDERYGPIYVHGGHQDDPRPYHIGYWLESGFCSVMRNGKNINCFTKHSRWEDQLFRPEDVRKDPWSGEFAKNAPPSYEISAASSSSSASHSSQDSSIDPPKYETINEYDRWTAGDSKKR